MTDNWRIWDGEGGAPPPKGVGRLGSAFENREGVLFKEKTVLVTPIGNKQNSLNKTR